MSAEGGATGFARIVAELLTATFGGDNAAVTAQTQETPPRP